MKCVLIYDDDQEILFLCKAILAKTNYRVETRLRCDDVLSDIDAIKPNIILMDLRIPKLGGKKAVSIIKENAATQNIPVIIFSADGSIKEISKKANANGYMEKPFDIAIFKETIEKNIL
jgi:DNA-binding response OmpR family regulator